MQGLSKEFRRKHVPDFRKMSKGVIFQLLNIRYDKLANVFLIPETKQVPSMDRIFDPYANEGEGDYVDIFYTKSARPTKPGQEKATQVILGNIAFNRELKGQIRFGGKNHAEVKGKELSLCEYMWLCNYNKDNVGKPYHIRPMIGYIFRILDSQRSVETALEKEELILKAKVMVGKMTNEEVDQICIGTMPQHFNARPDEKRLYLLWMAQGDAHKLLEAVNDELVISRSLVRRAENEGVIYYDLNANAWRFSSNEEVICHKRPGKSSLDSIADFILSDSGKGIYTSLDDMITQARIKSKGPREKHMPASPPPEQPGLHEAIEKSGNYNEVEEKLRAMGAGEMEQVEAENGPPKKRGRVAKVKGSPAGGDNVIKSIDFEEMEGD